MANQNANPKSGSKKEKINISVTMFIGMTVIMFLFGFLIGEEFFNDVAKMRGLQQTQQFQKQQIQTLQELLDKEMEAVRKCEKVLMGDSTREIYKSFSGLKPFKKKPITVDDLAVGSKSL